MKVFKVLLVFLISSGASFAQISGVAFRDYNGNGIKDSAGEPGVAGVFIKLYVNTTLPTKDLLIGVDETDINGFYDFSTPTSGRGPNPGENVRVEFEIPSNANCGFLSNQLDFSSQGGALYGSAVQFVTSPQSNVNFALNYSGEYVLNPNPNIYVPCYVNGDPLAGGTAGTRDAFIGAGFTWEGRPISNGPPNVAPNPIHLASASQIGSTYGVAFSRQSQKLFTSAYLKRHVGLGPLGPGGIYQIDPSTGTVTNFLNLHDINIFTSDVVNPYVGNTVVGTVVPFSPVVGSNVQRGLLPSATLPNVDAQAWEQVGKVSIGDLDISDDGRYLYLVNLYDRKVYEIDLVDPFNPQAPTLANVGTRVKSWATPDPGTTAAQGEHRPFGLAYYRGELYVGTVLSAQNLTGDVVGTEADMSGYLHKTTPGTGTWQEVLNFPMSYRVEQDWYPWSNNAIGTYEIGTPMISDIAFYKNGEILIGIRDRWADQKGWFNYGVDGDFAGLGSLGEVGISAGDLIRYNPVIQPDGSCLYSLISGGAGGEFYNDNYFHAESSAGALAMLPGGGDVVSTFMDPITVYSFGLAWYNNDTGGRNRTYEIGYSGDVSTFGKANGLGDIEVSGNTPGLEIGNYVWRDIDRDGIQDGNEPPVANVKVQLLDAGGNVLATTTTNAQGGYYFNAGNVTDPAGNGYLGPIPFTNYTIRIAPSDFNNTGVAGTALENYVITSTNEIGTGLADYTDNDASIIGGIARFNITTGGPGETNHTFDFGFILCPQPGTSTPTTVCDNSSNIINLFDLLTGEDTGGTWTRESGSGGIFSSVNGTFTPQPGATTSIFRYTVGGGVCEVKSVTVTVNINAQPFAGNDGNGEGCEGGIIVLNLYDLITGEQVGGTWTRLTGTGGVFNAGAGTYALTTGATNSTFKYTIIGAAPCIDDEAIATVTVTGSCCVINANVLTLQCIDENTPSVITDNRLRVGLLATNQNPLLSIFNISVDGGTTVTPSTGTYGVPSFLLLGPGTGGSGATFTLTITDAVTGASCNATVQVVSPLNCLPAIPECLTPLCGTATIQVNGN